MKDLKNSGVLINKIEEGEAIDKEGIIGLSNLIKRIVDSAPVSIITVNKAGEITFVNEYFKNLSASKFPLYKSIFKIPFFVDEKLVPLYKKLLRDGTTFRKENCHTKNLKGEEKYINIVAVPLRDEKGDIEGCLSMATDVTEAVIAKLKLDNLNANLQKMVLRKTQQLYESNEKLKKSLKLKSQFIADASHELRTPLSIAKLNLEFFKKQFVDTDKTSLGILNDINGEIDRVAEIISDITFFTAIDEDSIERMHLEKIDLNRFIGNLTERVKPQADKKNIKIFFVKNKLKPVLKGDKSKIEKLFLNIITNSIKYGKKSGWVKVYVEPDLKEKMIRFVISDNGIGIPKKDLPYIFDRFYRANISRNDGEGGFGLGLAICKWIAEQHGGGISVKSTVGKGSVFTTTLPINA